MVFARRKWIILSWTLAGVLVAFVLLLRAPTLYQATTIIMAPEQEQSSAALVGQVGALSAFAGNFGFRSPADLFLSILATNTVLLDMVDRYHLMQAYGIPDREAASGILRARSKLSATKEGLIIIQVEDKDPKRAATLATAYSDELFQQNNRLAIGAAARRRLFFQQQLAEEKNHLADAEVALKSTQQTTGVLQLGGQAENLIRQEADIEANITGHEVQLAAMQSGSTAQNPEVIRLRTELQGLREQLSQLRRGNSTEMLSQKQFPEIGLEYVRRQRDVAYHQTLYDVLARQLEAARIDEAKASPSVQVLDPPLIPRIRSWPKPSLFLGIGLVLGFVLGCIRVVVVWVYDYADADPRLSPRFHALKQALRPRT